MNKLQFKVKKPTRRSINIAIKALLGAMLLVLLFTVIYFGTGPSAISLYEGDISLKDTYAPYDFTYADELDAEKMEEAEQKVLSEVVLIYEINPQIEENTGRSIADFFAKSRDARGSDDLEGFDGKIEKLEGVSAISLSRETYEALIKAEAIDAAETAIAETAKQSLGTGILSVVDKEFLKNEGVSTIIILNPIDNSERPEEIAGLQTLDEFMAKASNSMVGYIPKDADLREASNEILKTLMSSNIHYSPEQTEKRKQEALSKIPKIYKKISVKKNEILIEKGEKVAKKHLKMLTHLGKVGEIGGRLFYLIGMAFLLLIFLFIAIVHLKYYESQIFRDNKKLLVICLSTFFLMMIAQMIVNSPLSSYLIPLASASMIIAILLDAHSAFIFTVILSILIGIIAGNNFGLMIVMFIGSSVGIYSVRRVRRRSKLLLAGCLVGVASFLTITALNFLNNIDPRLFLPEGLLGLGSGIVSFFLCFGFIPILEYVFKIPTDITLLELSDLNHPLLKEMATKAPGTYHHSLIVGNLAENATDAIGANTLLARVGAYYHDIGKIEKAEYFSENEGEPKNSRHESLTPSMSALVIIKHVKDGIDLARKHKLSQPLVDFISQHHGNGLIYFFYQRALEKVENENEIDEEAFRYPGPRPQSKEAAIVLLADSVEASSRTLINPTPSRVEGLVQRIVNNKFIDGQLDECALTLKDLHKISEAFVRILNAMFHTRVEYPDNEKENENRVGKNSHKKPDKKTDPKGVSHKGNGNKGS